jgi:glutaconyl-CoA/methylmalonyl-CoA decarboxylase subunit gamma
MNKDVLLGRRVKVTVNGKGYVVEVAGSLLSSPVTVKVNGQPYVVDVEPAEVTTKKAPSAAVHEAVTRPTAAPPKAPTPTAPAGPSVASLKAPMPGVIIEVTAKAGDRVKYGQPMCTLEAMKMNNTIRSPRDGVVATSEVSVGKSVVHGEVLFTFEVSAAAPEETESE